MKLHGDLMSPFVRMCMATAMECGLGMRVQLVSAAVKPHEVNTTIEAQNPIGRIPVLERDNEHAIYDSRVIMAYFCSTSGNATLLPSDPSKRFRVLTTLALAQGVAEAAVALRYETFARPEALRWPDMTTRLRARIDAGLDALEHDGLGLLQDVTVASIGTACALSYIDARQLMPNWQSKRSWLSHWHEQFCKRESMVHTAPRV